jgi:hypothetical protein
MTHFQLNKFAFLVLIICILGSIFTSCEVEDISGNHYYISNEVRKHMADTTQKYIDMVDNVQMKERFKVERSYFFYTEDPNYLYFSTFTGAGYISGVAYSENFSIAYKSMLNQYYFRYRITGNYGNETMLEVKWCEDSYNFNKNEYNDNNRFEYNFRTKKVTSKVKPKIRFYDSLIVSNKTYFDIIEIDYSSIKNKINNNTPIKIFFAGKAGIIKFMPVEGVVLERVE